MPSESKPENSLTFLAKSLTRAAPALITVGLVEFQSPPSAQTPGPITSYADAAICTLPLTPGLAPASKKSCHVLIVPPTATGSYTTPATP